MFWVILGFVLLSLFVVLCVAVFEATVDLRISVVLSNVYTLGGVSLPILFTFWLGGPVYVTTDWVVLAFVGAAWVFVLAWLLYHSLTSESDVRRAQRAKMLLFGKTKRLGHVSWCDYVWIAVSLVAYMGFVAIAHASPPADATGQCLIAVAGVIIVGVFAAYSRHVVRYVQEDPVAAAWCRMRIIWNVLIVYTALFAGFTGLSIVQTPTVPVLLAVECGFNIICGFVVLVVAIGLSRDCCAKRLPWTHNNQHGVEDGR